MMVIIRPAAFSLSRSCSKASISRAFCFASASSTMPAAARTLSACSRLASASAFFSKTHSFTAAAARSSKSAYSSMPAAKLAVYSSTSLSKAATWEARWYLACWSIWSTCMFFARCSSLFRVVPRRRPYHPRRATQLSSSSAPCSSSCSCSASSSNCVNDMTSPGLTSVSNIHWIRPIVAWPRYRPSAIAGEDRMFRTQAARVMPSELWVIAV
mmetsp:Transcript_121815/g.279143  ORF Transcript_121815/g.279143 Transcript_121815/m.279143 type:complete len:213 (-) Transcript_121815:299-937(-)